MCASDAAHSNLFLKIPITKFILHVCVLHNLFRTLNNNNITSLPRDVLNGMPRIRALRLSDNPFACDCHLSWLSKFLRSASRLAPYTRCHSPSQLKGQNVADLHDQEFKCSGSLREFILLHSNNDSNYFYMVYICMYIVYILPNTPITCYTVLRIYSVY